MMLPSTRYEESRMYSPALGLAAGQEPNGEHRAGTVYVAEQIDTFSAPFTLTEWDLATGQALQRTALPVDPTNTSPVMVFAGGRLHLVDWGFDHRPYYFQLTPSLQVVAKDHVIGMAGPRPNALASDGALTVIVARDPAWDGATEFARTFAVTFEAAGKPLSRRALDPPGESPSSALLQDNAAVASGDVYVLHHSDAGLSILRLAADLRDVARQPLTTAAGWPNATLRAEGDHLVVDVPPESFEVALDLSRVSSVPQGSIPFRGLLDGAWCDGNAVSMGPVRAILCYHTDGASRRHFVAWDRAGGDVAGPRQDSRPQQGDAGIDR
jgi:hypothetical protein